MKLTWMTSAAIIALIALGATAHADADDTESAGWGWGGGHGYMMQRMTSIDANGDGAISDDEAAAQVEAVFLAMDTDEDGELTPEEFMAVRLGRGEGRNADRQKAMQDRKQTRFTGMDTDKSGKVSKAEFIAAGQARFLGADTDKNGKVTPWEFRAQHW
jgi:Ca2+-binding EF-hand superfamily protein